MTHNLHQSSLALNKSNIKLGYGLIAIWVLAMVSVPILRWAWGDIAIRHGIIITIVAQCSAVIYFLWQSWGAKRTLLSFAAAVSITWLSEKIGSATGFPFGEYHYTPFLQPQLGGVPLLIPIAWFMMLPPSWAVAYSILGNYRGRFAFVAFVCLSAAALTAWDLFLDPQMVRWGLWVWEQPSGYFGIPWVNFVGWVLVAIVVTALIRPPRFRLGPHLTIYAIVWLLQSIGQLIFWDLHGPAIVGFIVMGGFLAMGYWGYKRRS